MTKPLPTDKEYREEYLQRVDQVKRGKKARATRRKVERKNIRKGKL